METCFRKLLPAGLLLLLLAGCATPPPTIPNNPGCVGCGAEAGNSGAGTYYAGGRELWQRP